MISVVVCSNSDPAWTGHEEHVRKTAGVPLEYLRIDNRQKNEGIGTVYNRAVSAARGSIVLFLHEDLFFVLPNWAPVLEQKFADDPTLAGVGVAGTRYLSAESPAWVAAGRPFILGKVIHQTPESEKCLLTVYSSEKEDQEAVAMDGLFLAVSRPLLNHVSFDDARFDGFHFYDLDICMQLREHGRLVVTADILVKHLSGGSFDSAWRRYGNAFLEKYRDRLPASCGEGTPPSHGRIPFQSVWLDAVMQPDNVRYIRNLGEPPRHAGLHQRETGRGTCTIVTGMHRSGTSAVTGLLSRCGFSLGGKHRLLNNNEPRFDNEKGHFENYEAVVINESLLKLAEGTWYRPPSSEAISRAGGALQPHMASFMTTFDGDLVKDPRFCMTLSEWKAVGGIRRVVICVRHPYAVATSLNRRDKLPMEAGYALWEEYNRRLIDNIEGVGAIVVDYDTLTENAPEALLALLGALGEKPDKTVVREATAGFFEPSLNHSRPGNEETAGLPPSVRRLYSILLSQSVTTGTGGA